MRTRAQFVGAGKSTALFSDGGCAGAGLRFLALLLLDCDIEGKSLALVMDGGAFAR